MNADERSQFLAVRLLCSSWPRWLKTTQTYSNFILASSFIGLAASTKPGDNEDLLRIAIFFGALAFFLSAVAVSMIMASLKLVEDINGWLERDDTVRKVDAEIMKKFTFIERISFPIAASNTASILCLFVSVILITWINVSANLAIAIAVVGSICGLAVLLCNVIFEPYIFSKILPHPQENLERVAVEWTGAKLGEKALED